MKLHTVLCPALLCASAVFVLASQMRLHAQTAPTAIPPVPSPAPSVSTPQATPAPKKALSLQVNSGNLETAVNQLLQAVKAAQLPEINVIYGPGAAEVIVPDLSIRNVSPADGLRLIATSAGCETQAIFSTQDPETIIGYKVGAPAAVAKIEPGYAEAPANPANYAPGTVPGPFGIRSAPGNKESAYGQGFYQGESKNRIQSAPAGMPTPTKTLKGQGGGRGVLNMTGDGRIVAMGLTSQNPAVRIYPLGTITTTVKFPDIEATLHDVLKAEGAIAEATKLALHEKTNVLVVTGPPQAQELVSQCIEALQKNQLAADDAAGIRNDITRETTQLRIELQAQEREKARLNEQLAKTEAELRDLAHEMDRLKAAKTP
jgi:hypothetical protein